MCVGVFVCFATIARGAASRGAGGGGGMLSFFLHCLCVYTSLYGLYACVCVFCEDGVTGVWCRQVVMRFAFFNFLLVWANVQEWVQTLAERVVVVKEEAPDYIELKVMSLCRYIIVANSSFSWSFFTFSTFLFCVFSSFFVLHPPFFLLFHARIGPTHIRWAAYLSAATSSADEGERGEAGAEGESGGDDPDGLGLRGFRDDDDAGSVGWGGRGEGGVGGKRAGQVVAPAEWFGAGEGVGGRVGRWEGGWVGG